MSDNVVRLPVSYTGSSVANCDLCLHSQQRVFDDLRCFAHGGRSTQAVNADGACKRWTPRPALPVEEPRPQQVATAHSRGTTVAWTIFVVVVAVGAWMLGRWA